MTSLSPNTTESVTDCLSNQLTSLAPIINTLLTSVPALKARTANDLTVTKHYRVSD